MSAINKEMEEPGSSGRVFYFIIKIGCLRLGLNEKLYHISLVAVHLKSV